MQGINKKGFVQNINKYSHYKQVFVGEISKVNLTLSRKLALKFLYSSSRIYEPFLSCVSRMRIHRDITDMKKVVYTI